MWKIAIVCLAGVVVGAPALGQEVWGGYGVSFAKPDGADWTLEINQDRITENVWITRRDSGGLFNFAAEPQFGPGSPADTAWAVGTTADLGTLTFEAWRDAVMMCPPCVVDVAMVVHLITDDIYIDIRMTSWTSTDGGGFSYERGQAPPSACNGADVAEPRGVLDFSDVVGFLVLFGGQDPAADLAAPTGVFDISDVVAFLGLFGAGCP